MKPCLFDQICSLDNLLTAWHKFSAGKHSKEDVMAYERYLEDNIFILRDGLLSGKYQHGVYHPFTINDPKQRSISKATVKDRIVHQALVNIIEPFLKGNLFLTVIRAVLAKEHMPPFDDCGRFCCG